MERLGIAGAGTISTGLAALASTKLDVVLCARTEESAARASEAVAKSCARMADQGADAARVLSLVGVGQLAGCTYVVEAIAEDHGLKADLLTRIAAVIGKDAVLATTTSSLSVAELAAASGMPERFVGLHVFNPVPRMALVELVFPDAASPSTRARTRGLCELLGKTAVEVPDTPGFVVNRLLFPYLFDAVAFMSSTGLTPEAVDTCMTLGAGLPMGPLALLDFVGLDVSKAIGESIGAEIPAALLERVESGALGRKSGSGFYMYP